MSQGGSACRARLLEGSATGGECRRLASARRASCLLVAHGCVHESFSRASARSSAEARGLLRGAAEQPTGSVRQRRAAGRVVLQHVRRRPEGSSRGTARVRQQAELELVRRRGRRCRRARGWSSRRDAVVRDAREARHPVHHQVAVAHPDPRLDSTRSPRQECARAHAPPSRCSPACRRPRTRRRGRSPAEISTPIGSSTTSRAGGISRRLRGGGAATRGVATA